LSAKFYYDILYFGKGLNTTSTGMGGDGSQGVLEWVEMDVKGAGNGGDGTEIPSVCRPLVACNQLVQTDGCMTVSYTLLHTYTHPV